MSLEEALRATVAEKSPNARFDQQMNNFRDFERKMAAGGCRIEKESFTIPLMDRVSASYLYS